MAIFQELKRRNVYRVGAAYVVISWLILQVADVIIGNIGAPGWLFKAILIALIIGFPLALILAWAFELTPEGIKRDSEVKGQESVSRNTARKLDRIIIAVLAVAVVYFVADKWIIGSGLSIDSPSTASLERSIAVLPFSNRSTVIEDAHFVDGIHDDILTQLAKLSSLDKVISRTSTEQYRGTEKPMQQIGRELGVATILEGGVQRAGNRVRINMQLINAATDEHLWADTYDREMTLEGIFDIQTEIAREVVTALHGVLSEEDEERLASMPTDSLEAYEQFVLGRRELANRTADSLARSAAHFERAIELDPDYALAYVGLADAIAMHVEYAAMDFAESAEPRQRHIDKALSLDPLLGEAYASLGLLRYWGRDLEEAETAFRKAIELGPNYASAYHWYSILLRRQKDRQEESLAMMRKAVSLDPAAPILIASLVDNLRFAGNIEEAESVLRDAVKRNPRFANFYMVMRDILVNQGRIGEAAAWNDRANELNPSNFRSRMASCHLLLELDDPEAAEVCLEALRADFWEFPEATLAGLVNLKTHILLVSGEAQAALDYAQQAASTSADPRVHGNLVGAYMMNGEWEKARPMLEAFTPKFFAEGEIVVSASEVLPAFNAAATMREGEGWSERAHYLAGQVLATMQTMHRGRGIPYGFLDVPAHGIRGEFQEAMSAMRSAIESGWRYNWWMLRTPSYEVVRLDEVYGAEWNAMIAELESDIAEQRRWYYEHKDDPLF